MIRSYHSERIRPVSTLMEMTHATSHGAISIPLDDMGEAALRGKRARKLVERHFTWDKVADSTIDVYDDVVANGRKY